MARRIDALLASRWSKVVVFLGGLAPLAVLVWKGFHAGLSANPIEFVEHWTGDWTLRFLLASLVVTPARRLLHLSQLIRFRRMLGLFAFFWACLHLTTWVGLDHFFAWRDLLADVAKRRYITVGFTAFLILLPLAVTSTRGWIRRLGKRWQKLHRLVYLAALLGVVHFWWLVKSDHTEPAIYAASLALLLAARLVPRRRSGAPAPARHETAEDAMVPAVAGDDTR